MRTLHFGYICLSIFSTAIVAEAALPPNQRNVAKEEKKPVSLEDVLGNYLGASGFGGNWVPGLNNTLRVITGNNVWEYNVANQENNTIVDSSVFDERFGGQGLGLSFSADMKFILVEHSRRSLWRHSYLAKYDVYSIENRNFSIIQPRGLEGQEQVHLQLVQWAPTGHSLAFIFENNIYYKKSHGISDTNEPITKDGGDSVFNGISDWVYEEEMLGSPVALWFSKDSGNLAFIKFNDTNVQLYQWPVYGEPGVPETVYPIYEPIRYPKTGTSNPDVSVHIVNLNNPTKPPRQITYPPLQDKELQHYIATLIWTTASDLIVVNLNRHQNESVWNYCDATTANADCKEIYHHTQENGWIDAHTPTISKDGSKFLTLQNVAQSSDSNRSYKHIVSVPTSGSALFTPVTSGALNVDSILGWDETGNKIYFSGTGLHQDLSVADPSERHVYFVESSGVNAKPSCLSCDLKTEANEECRSHAFTFSPNFEFYMHAMRGPSVPQVITRKTSDHSIVKVWADNQELRTKLNSRLLPSTRDINVDIGGGFVGKVRLYLPPNFQENAKYPLLIDVYAGPDSQKITQDFKVDWGTYLASAQGVIYASIDGRGSGRQSADLKYSVYRNLGSVEIEDQIAVTKHLVDTLSFIDANKTAIWGWSYGGYATAMALGKDFGNVFKCGVSVAPVTSWLYYDTIYTERYMGLPTPEDNWDKYNASSVMNHIKNFKSKNFMLIHGNADDNVHYQQSMMLARALEKVDIMFNQLSYPDENHGINGPNMRRHLYHSIEKFLARDCFGQLGTRSAATTFNLSFILTFVSVILAIYQKL